MALSVVYTVVDGVMWQENRGGTITQYVPDTLGSVVAEMDEAGQITHAADYWPYGEVRAETGTKKSPFGFVGVLGYMKDFADALYVRARYLRTRLGRWQTKDPLWPFESAFGYVSSTPTYKRDPSGRAALPVPVTGCLLGAGASIIVSIGIWAAGKGSLNNTLCKALLSCLIGALVTFLLGLSLGVLAACMVGFLASLAGQAANALCDRLTTGRCRISYKCGIATAIASGLIGCMSGGTSSMTIDEIAGEGASAVVSVIMGGLARICPETQNLTSGL